MFQSPADDPLPSKNVGLTPERTFVPENYKKVLWSVLCHHFLPKFVNNEYMYFEYEGRFSDDPESKSIRALMNDLFRKAEI